MTTGCSAAWLAHVLWVHGVAGSNPASPTRRIRMLAAYGGCAGGRNTFSGGRAPPTPTVRAGVFVVRGGPRPPDPHGAGDVTTVGRETAGSSRHTAGVRAG